MFDLEPLLTFWQSWRHCGENILVAGLVIEGIALFFEKWKWLEKNIITLGTLTIIVGVIIENISGNHTDEVVHRMRSPTTITSAERSALLACLKKGGKDTVFVVPILFDDNAQQYAEKVLALLKDAGFDSQPEPPKASAPFSYRSAGAVLFVKDLASAIWGYDNTAVFRRKWVSSARIAKHFELGRR